MFPLPQSPPEPPSHATEPRYNHSRSKSAITLLSIEENGQSRSHSPVPPAHPDEDEPTGERKPKRLSRRGILGVRDLLLSIKRSRDKEAALRRQLKEKETQSPLPGLPPLPRFQSSSSDDLVPTCGTPQRRRKKISTGPVDIISPKPVSKPDLLHASYADPEKWEKTKTIGSGPHRLSPRRPSLSALFRFGHSSPGASGKRNSSKSRTRNGETPPVRGAEDTRGGPTSFAAAARDGEDGDGEEWDRMELEELEQNIPSAVNGYQEDATTRAVRSLGSQSGVLVTAGLGMGIVSGGVLKRRKRGPSSEPGEPPPKNARTDFSTSSISLGIASNASKDDAIDATTKPPSNKLKCKLPDHKAKSNGGSRPSSPLAQVISPHAIRYAQPGAPRSFSRDLSAASVSSVNLPQTPQLAILQSPTAQEQLALTPQNLVPLLKYAKEVRTRLMECLEELSGIENEFIGTNPRLRNPGRESEADTRNTLADASTSLVRKGHDPDSSLDSVEVVDPMGGLGRSI
jgi:serine/arginine repetitive matrix protein 2